MSNEENIDVIKSGMEAYNARDWARHSETIAEFIVYYSPESLEPVKGLDASKERFKANAEAFPDYHIETKQVFGQGDWVVLEGVFTGTHKGAFPTPGGQEIPPTGKRVELPELWVFKVEGGKVAEEHDYYDNLTFLSQLGLAPQ